MSAPLVFAVLGDPVGQSLSPAMHNAWYLDHGINAVYVALRLRADRAPMVMPLLGGLGLSGANVTTPLKDLAGKAAQQVDPAVEALGAANTLAVGEDGAMAAFNTDAPGFVLALDDAAPGWRDTARRVLVIGAGGAGRAIAYGLKRAGASSLVMANRDRAKAQAFVDGLGGAAIGMDELADGFASADVIVNATSLGMGGRGGCIGGGPVWPFHAAPAHAIVADAVYAPLDTNFLVQARTRGLACVDGLGMLIGQGALAFQLWFGLLPDRAVARERLMRILAERG